MWILQKHDAGKITVVGTFLDHDEAQAKALQMNKKNAYKGWTFVVVWG